MMFICCYATDIIDYASCRRYFHYALRHYAACFCADDAADFHAFAVDAIAAAELVFFAAARC